MIDCFASLPGESSDFSCSDASTSDSSIEEHESGSWVQVEFGGRIYLVPRS